LAGKAVFPDHQVEEMDFMAAVLDGCRDTGEPHRENGHIDLFRVGGNQQDSHLLLLKRKRGQSEQRDYGFIPVTVNAVRVQRKAPDRLWACNSASHSSPVEVGSRPLSTARLTVSLKL